MYEQSGEEKFLFRRHRRRNLGDLDPWLVLKMLKVAYLRGCLV